MLREQWTLYSDIGYHIIVLVTVNHTNNAPLIRLRLGGIEICFY